LITAVFAYLRSADLSVYEEQIEGFLSDAIGHKLDVDGVFELRFGGMTQMTAENITLSNRDWQPDPVIVSVGHLSATVDLWSLVFGPVIIEGLDIRDVDVRLERDAESKGNWQSGKTRDDAEPKAEFDSDWVAFREVRIQDVRFAFSDPAQRRPLEVTLEQLTLSPDENNILDLDLSGMINEFSLRADGKVGPWENLIDGKDTSADLDLTVGPIRLGIEGTIADLSTLAGVEAWFGFSGPAVDRITDVLGLPPFAEGEFQVDGKIRRTDGGSQLRLDGYLGAIEIFVSGTVDVLIEPQRVELDFNFSGPDTQYVAEVFGIKDAPAAPFRILGDLKKRESRYEFSRLQVQLAHGEIDASGWIDLSNAFPDGDVTISATGPDLSLIGPFARIRGMPAEAFNVSGQIQKSGADWRFDDFTGQVGDNQIRANGQLGGKDGAANEISISMTGPDVSMLQPITGLKGLPSGSFDVSARVKKQGAGLLVEEAKAVFGDYSLDVKGVIGTGKGLTGTSLQVRGSGPELENVALLTEVVFLPSGPFEFAGRMRIDRNLLYVNDATVAVSDTRGAVDGSFGLANDLGEFDLEVSGSGSDAANLMQIEWLERMSGQAFKFDGSVKHRGKQYELKSINAAIGNLEISVDGGFENGGETIDVLLNASSPDTAVLSALTRFDDLPDGAVSMSGRIRKTDADMEFTDAEVLIGDYAFAVDGRLSTTPLSNKSDLRFSLSGPDLRELGMQVQIDGMPALPFLASGEVNGTPTGFVVEDLVAIIGDSNISGEYTADLSDKPLVTGVLTSSYLDLTALQVPDDAEAADDEEERSEFLFSDEPFPALWLQAANVDVMLQADRLKIRQGEFQDFAIGLGLSDGILDIDPVSFRGSAGKTSGQAQLLSSNGSYVVDVSLALENIHFGSLATPDQDQMTLPRLDGQLDLRGTGNSLHEVLASSNGSLVLTQGAGRIRDPVHLRLFGDLMLEVIRTLNPTRKPEEHIVLECGTYGVEVKDGVATIQYFAVQTDRMAIVTRGELNFKDERLNLSIQAAPRQGIGVSISAIPNSLLKLGGTLRRPQLEISSTAAVAAGAAVATGGLSLVATSLWSRVAARADICKDLQSDRKSE
jgi:uncharacterized protein involved in outer membrane biogenesis